MSRIPGIARTLAEGEGGSLRTIEEARSAAEESLRLSSGSEGKLDTSLLDKKPSTGPFGPKLQSGENHLLSLDDARIVRNFNSAIENVDKSVRGLTIDHPEGSIAMDGWWGTVKDQMYVGKWAEAATNIDAMLKLQDFARSYGEAEFAKSLHEVLTKIR